MLRTVKPSTQSKSSIIGRVFESPPLLTYSPYHSSPLASSVPPPSITTFDNLLHFLQSSHPTLGSLISRQRPALSKPAWAHTMSELRRVYTIGASPVDSRLFKSPVAVPRRVAPASILRVRSERSHKLAVRRIKPDFTRTVPPSPPKSPQSSMACCRAAVALLLLVALYGGEDTSHSFPDFHPSLWTARAAPGTGCERMLDPKGPGPGGKDAKANAKT